MQRYGGNLFCAALAMAGLLTLPGVARTEAYQGYTLFSGNGSTTTSLVDMSNTTVKSWTHTRPGGYSVYLLENGNIMRPAESTGSSLNGGAAAGLVQTYDPNSNLVWNYQYSSNLVRSHHDIEPMPNGNVLLIAWERKTATQAVQAGLDSSTEIWPEHIVEVQPTGATTGTIVWKWHAWDHLIQDHDATKDNYGVVGNHPELLDVNIGGSPLGGDWMHVNGISYNPDLDQIVISSHFLNEIYVIDHSTTTEEAAGHSGGLSGKGGDILYRWGMPSNYDAPGAGYFDVVHCGYWIPNDCPGAGNLMAYNNRDGQGTSIVAELIPPSDGAGNYPLVPGQAYGPAAPSWTYTAPGFYSAHLGGCQRLPNGNTFIVESTSGYMFEVNSAGAIQWSYARGGEIARALRYGGVYPGLVALGLVTVDAASGGAAPVRPTLHQNEPNPCRGQTQIRYDLPATGPVSLKVFDLLGRELRTLVDGYQTNGRQSISFNTSRLANGTYFYRIEANGVTQTKKLILQR